MTHDPHAADPHAARPAAAPHDGDAAHAAHTAHTAHTANDGHDAHAARSGRPEGTADPHRESLVRFFERHLRPLGAQRGLLTSAHAPAAGASSYYEVLDRPPLAPADFEIPLGTPEEIAATLDRFWAGTPLAGLGAKLVKLSAEFDDVREKAEVSSFVYEMF